MTGRKTGCGTSAGYQAHNRAKEPACRECLDAYAIAMKAYRHRTGRSTRSIIDDTTLTKHGIRVPK